MFKIFERNNKLNRGFTLIELLIVMAIIGILTAIGAGNFRSTRAKARDAVKKSDLSQIAKSLEAYYNDHKQFPSSDANGRIICRPPATICAWGGVFSDANGTVYSANLPEDSRSNFYYVYSSTGPSYELYTHIENDNDPSIQSSLGVNCSATVECNYRITSTNIN